MVEAAMINPNQVEVPVGQFVQIVRTYVNDVRNICHLELANPLTKHTLFVIG